MTPWVRTLAWIVFWATLLVALVLGAFVAWLLTEVLPPGTVITIDGERFVLTEFNHAGQWLAALTVVLAAALVIVIAVPLVTVLALGVPLVAGTLGLALGLLAVGLVLWPAYLLGRWLWQRGQRSKTTTIAP
jgi:hypothetical protein